MLWGIDTSKEQKQYYILKILNSISPIFKTFLMFIFEREREREREREKERETERQRARAGEGQRGRHRIRSRLQVLSCQPRARHGAQTHEP